MEKLLGQLSTHVSLEHERQMKALAEVKGVAVSEYLRDLIAEHLNKKQREYQILRDAFESPQFAQFGEFAQNESP